MLKNVRFRLIDCISMAFVCFNIAYVALMHKQISQPALLLRAYLVGLIFMVAIIIFGDPERYEVPGSRLGKAVRWVLGFARETYALALFPFFFEAVTRFDTALLGRNLDPYFAAMDTFLFGFVPSATLMFDYPIFLLSELLHGAYVMYYVSIPGLALWLYIKNRRALPEYIAVTMFIFYIACLTYVVLPVVGGRFDPAVRAMTETYKYGPFTRIMTFIYRASAHEGGAFPSTHAIVSLVIALFSRRTTKPLAVLLGINTVLVFAATIYCGYHYVVDLIAALVYVAVFYPLGRRLYASFRIEPDTVGFSDIDAA